MSDRPRGLVWAGMLAVAGGFFCLAGYVKSCGPGGEWAARVRHAAATPFPGPRQEAGRKAGPTLEQVIRGYRGGQDPAEVIDEPHETPASPAGKGAY